MTRLEPHRARLSPARWLDGVRWYARELTGDARYDRYVEECRAAGRVPLPRAAYERERSDHRDRHPEGRCC